ncbi:hypothetical protein GCM10025857_08980 [Alicyclobacillus contaminans]|nr:hypothetical protein GCM10025857_08980 [Alicyclobacillus contaminans]
MSMLSGIRVLDFTTLLPGPYASLRLSELGATVIQVEPPAGIPRDTSGRNALEKVWSSRRITVGNKVFA